MKPHSFNPARLHKLKMGDEGSMTAELRKFNKLDSSRIPTLVEEPTSPMQRYEIGGAAAGSVGIITSPSSEAG